MDTDHHQPFTIDPHTGVISIKGSLDYERRTQYTLSVRAFNRVNPKQFQQATVSIRYLGFLISLPELQNDFRFSPTAPDFYFTLKVLEIRYAFQLTNPISPVPVLWMKTTTRPCSSNTPSPLTSWTALLPGDRSGWPWPGTRIVGQMGRCTIHSSLPSTVTYSSEYN